MAAHPDWEPMDDWSEEVPVVRYETDDEVVLIDPFLPPDGTTRIREAVAEARRP